MKKTSVIFIVFSLTLLLTNCYKEEDTTATITVVDGSSVPVVGVLVYLHCPSATCTNSQLAANMKVSGITGTDGKVTFNFTEQYQAGQAGFAVLDVEVHLTAATGGTPEATGVIKIEEEVENEQTIICQTCP